MGEAEEVDVVLIGEAGESGAKEHGLIVWVSEDEEDMVLFADFHLLLVEVDEDEGGDVEGEEHVLERGINKLR